MPRQSQSDCLDKARVSKLANQGGAGDHHQQPSAELRSGEAHHDRSQDWVLGAGGDGA